MSFVQNKFPENPRMAPEKYGMYEYTPSILQVYLVGLNSIYSW